MKQHNDFPQGFFHGPGLPKKHIENKKLNSVKFCWECGRKLWGGKGVPIEVDGKDRVVHKSCAEQRKRFGYIMEVHPCNNCRHKNDPRDAYPCMVCEAF